MSASIGINIQGREGQEGARVEAIDRLGLFWLAESPDEQLSGRLTFEPRTGLKVDLVGEFDGQHSESRTNVRLHGWLGSSKVTLVDCFSSKESHPSQGVISSSFVANGLFIGDHIDERTATFETVHLELSDLDNWVGSTGMEDSFDGARSATRPLYTSSFTPIERASEDFRRGSVRIESMWKHTAHYRRGGGFETWPAIRLTYFTPQAFKTVRQDCARIRDLLSLCIDGPSTIDKLAISSELIRGRMLDGSDGGPQTIEYVAPLTGYVEPADRKPREQYRMLLTFDELGGTTTVARWLDVVEGFQMALNSMMSITHAAQMFGENRFLNVTYAAEAFHRVTIGGGYLPDDDYEAMLAEIVASTPVEHHEWVRNRLEHGNQPTLRRRLYQLAGKAGKAVRPLIGDKGNWAFAVAHVRNDLTHLGDSSMISGADLRHLAESVYAVTRVCMLLEAGVPIAALEAKAESVNVTWYRDHLQHAISRARSKTNH